MDYVKITHPQCFSHVKPLNITREFFDLLSEFIYDGEGKVALPMFLQDFFAMLDKEDGCFDEEASLLLAYTLRESPQQ